MENNIPTALQSSVDPKKISLTIESFGKTVIGLVAVLATYKGLDPAGATSAFQAIIDNVAIGVTAAFTVYNSAMTVYGLARKGYVAIFKKVQG